ncbi:MAG: S8 family serine peptidase [Chloroflexi bacterium]|nr:S8 family serine peptidase [Chloroflexota bacterium]
MRAARAAALATLLFALAAYLLGRQAGASAAPLPRVSPPPYLAETSTLLPPPAQPTDTPLPSATPEKIEPSATPLPAEATATQRPTEAGGATPTRALLTPAGTDPAKATQEATAMPTLFAPTRVRPTATLSPGGVNGDYIEGELVVQFDPGLKHRAISDILAVINASSAELIPDLGYWLVKVPQGQTPAALAFLEHHKQVQVVEPNYLAQALAIPADPGWAQQGYLVNIQAPAAWDVVSGSPDVVIAIVDTGVDASHPDLAAKLWSNAGEMGKDGKGGDRRSNGKDDDGNGYVDDWLGWNAIENNGKVYDDQGHGTLMAGVAAAQANNGVGIAGVAWGARLMTLKALDSNGQGGYAQIAKAIVYAVRRGARVINLSLGGLPYSALLNVAVDYAHANGVVVVAAAGDSGSAAVMYPAAYTHALSVGATDAHNRPAAFSAYGEMVDLYAPGVNIYTTLVGGSYGTRSGASMAAAQVSGAAALLASLPGYGGAAQAGEALTASALRLEQGGPGLLQIYQAVQYSLNYGTPTPTPTPSEPPGMALPVYPMLPTAILPPPQPTATPVPGDPHVHYDADTDSCAGCHRAHTAVGQTLRDAWPEEQLCFSCHSAGGTGSNVQGAFTSYTNSATAFYKHDIAASSAVHVTGESAAANFGEANRHVECEDCHEAHEAARGFTLPPSIPYEMNWVSGVDPDWTLAGEPPAYTWLPHAEREYQPCFKCHSGFAALPAYLPSGWNGNAVVANGLRKLTSAAATQILDSRNLAQEFNPNNSSFHPLAAVGRNQSIPPGSFVAPWSQTSLVYCSDCHYNANQATQGAGPHGSPRLHLLGGANDYTTVDNNIQPASGEICFNCHQYNTYVNNGAAANTLFRDGGTNLHNLHANGENAPCYVCHDTHGSEQLHLINFDVSVVTVSGVNRNSQNAWEFTGGSGTCFIACHGQGHGAGLSYTP